MWFEFLWNRRYYVIVHMKTDSDVSLQGIEWPNPLESYQNTILTNTSPSPISHLFSFIGIFFSNLVGLKLIIVCSSKKTWALMLTVFSTKVKVPGVKKYWLGDFLLLTDVSYSWALAGPNCIVPRLCYSPIVSMLF